MSIRLTSSITSAFRITPHCAYLTRKKARAICLTLHVMPWACALSKSDAAPTTCKGNKDKPHQASGGGAAECFTPCGCGCPTLLRCAAVHQTL